jgi:His-Xaa-Ser system protein HxsD
MRSELEKRIRPEWRNQMQKNMCVTVTFDSNVYAVETIKKAAYRFLDRFATKLALDGTNVVCELTFPSEVTEESAHTAVADFQKEVLDQDLRQIVATETAGYRNAILALAFSSSKLTSNE